MKYYELKPLHLLSIRALSFVGEVHSISPTEKVRRILDRRGRCNENELFGYNCWDDWTSTCGMMF